MSTCLLAGWLELLFNSSLAVPWSVCTGKNRQGKGQSPWQQLASQLLHCAALPIETELAVLVHLSVSRSGSSGAPPTKPVQQADNLWQSSCLSWEPWEASEDPAGRLSAVPREEKPACASECPNPGTSPFSIPGPPLTLSFPVLKGEGLQLWLHRH